MKKLFLGSLFLLSCLIMQAQEKSVLLRIDGQPVYKSEFVRIYKRNSNLVKDSAKDDIDSYLRLFVDYKLKLKEAKAEGLDTLSSYRSQYKHYKNKLALNYMMNTEVADTLLREAYKRLQHDVEVSHILVKVAPDAPPADTLQAYKKIMRIRDELMDGCAFEDLAFEYSDDPSAKSNEGDIGWIDVFKTVYPFETAAYKTHTLRISQPVRTRFGYHLVKVNARRKNLGKVKVAMIFIKSKPDSTSTDAKARIEKICKKLNAGASFADMAKQYSDDKATAADGGKMKPFSRGQLSSEKFEEEAFSLTKDSPLSEPFKSQNGWYIIKLIKRYPIKPFDEIKESLAQKIKKDGRSLIIRDSLIKKLKAKYSVVESSPGLAFFKEKIGDSLLKATKARLPQKNMISLNGEGKTYREFWNRLHAYKFYQRGKMAFTPELLDKLHDKFKDNFIFIYQRDHLAESNKKYAHTIENYSDGMLIFALMKEKVWDKAKEDSLAVRAYYNAHKDDFKTPEKYKALIVSTDTKKTAKAVRQDLKRGKSVVYLKAHYPQILVNSGEFEKNNPRLPKNYRGKVGVSRVSRQNGVYLVVRTDKILPPHLKSFDESKGLATYAYQQKLKTEFMERLHKKYQVSINRKVVDKLKDQFE